jgi:predicted nucleic acid-binding Zn finger protein
LRKDLTAEELVKRFVNYSKFGSKFTKAIDAVLNDDIKEHVFTPSRRVVYTVVGRNGDEFVDPNKPYCSCNHFYFRVLGNQDQLCYHLLSYEIASQVGAFDKIEFDDDEYPQVLNVILSDISANIKDKGDKSTS